MLAMCDHVFTKAFVKIMFLALINKPISVIKSQSFQTYLRIIQLNGFLTVSISVHYKRCL